MVIKSDIETSQSMLTMKINDVNESITNEKLRIEKETKRGFTQQESENNRMKKQIEGMKVENSHIQKSVLSTQRRIRELDDFVGIQDDEPL